MTTPNFSLKKHIPEEWISEVLSQSSFLIYHPLSFINRPQFDFLLQDINFKESSLKPSLQTLGFQLHHKTSSFTRPTIIAPSLIDLYSTIYHHSHSLHRYPESSNPILPALTFAKKTPSGHQYQFVVLGKDNFPLQTDGWSLQLTHSDYYKQPSLELYQNFAQGKFPFHFFDFLNDELGLYLSLQRNIWLTPIIKRFSQKATTPSTA